MYRKPNTHLTAVKMYTFLGNIAKTQVCAGGMDGYVDVWGMRGVVCVRVCAVRIVDCAGELKAYQPYLQPSNPPSPVHARAPSPGSVSHSALLHAGQ